MVGRVLPSLNKRLNHGPSKPVIGTDGLTVYTNPHVCELEHPVPENEHPSGGKWYAKAWNLGLNH